MRSTNIQRLVRTLALLFGVFAAAATSADDVRVLTPLPHEEVSRIQSSCGAATGNNIVATVDTYPEVIVKALVNPRDFDVVLGLSTVDLNRLAEQGILTPADSIQLPTELRQLQEPGQFWIPIGGVFLMEPRQSNEPMSEWDRQRSAHPQEYMRPSVDGAALMADSANPDAAGSFIDCLINDPEAKSALSALYLLTPGAGLDPGVNQLPGNADCQRCSRNSDCTDSSKPICSSQGCCVANTP